MSSLWFVAAGTGGHIFPGIAVADELKRRHGDLEFLFFGTADRLEARLVPKAGYPIRFLSASQWKGRGLAGRVSALTNLVAGFFQVVGTLLKGRPRALVSVGGYVSAPTAVACRVFGVPLVLIEPNIRAGLANRMLSKVASKAYCAPGSDALKLFGCPTEDAGNPVRPDLAAATLRPEARRVLVLGGSQGALKLCEASIALARSMDLGARGVRLVLQSGEKNLEASRDLARQAGVESSVEIVPFIDNMAQALREADVVIARAGAMTVAELSTAGLPTIFVPFPFAADDHQRYNARLLAEDGAALLVDEREEGFAAKLQSALESLVAGPRQREVREALSKKLLRWARPRATETIARGIEEVARLN